VDTSACTICSHLKLSLTASRGTLNRPTIQHSSRASKAFTDDLVVTMTANMCAWVRAWIGTSAHTCRLRRIASTPKQGLRSLRIRVVFRSPGKFHFSDEAYAINQSIRRQINQNHTRRIVERQLTDIDSLSVSLSVRPSSHVAPHSCTLTTARVVECLVHLVTLPRSLNLHHTTVTAESY